MRETNSGVWRVGTLATTILTTNFTGIYYTIITTFFLHYPGTINTLYIKNISVFILNSYYNFNLSLLFLQRETWSIPTDFFTPDSGDISGHTTTCFLCFLEDQETERSFTNIFIHIDTWPTWSFFSRLEQKKLLADLDFCLVEVLFKLKTWKA